MKPDNSCNGPGTQSALKQRDETGDKEGGSQNLAGVLQLADAHCRCDDQRHSKHGAETCQTVLQEIQKKNKDGTYIFEPFNVKNGNFYIMIITLIRRDTAMLARSCVS